MDAGRLLASESGLRRGPSVTSVEQTPPQGGSYLLVLTNQLLLRRKARPVSPDPLYFHGKSIFIYLKSTKILAMNSNVTYNTGQPTVGHTRHLSKLAVARRLLLHLCSQTTPSSCSPPVLGPQNIWLIFMFPFSWLHTFTLCITQVELRHFSAWLPAKPQAQLVYL